MCGVSGVRPLIQLLEFGSRQDKYGNFINHLQEDKIKLPAKTQHVWLIGGVGRTPPAASSHRPSLVHYLVGPDVRWSVPGLGWSVWSSLWASFAHVTQDTIVCDFCLRSRRVFVLFRTCAPEIINLRKQLWR